MVMGILGSKALVLLAQTTVEQLYEVSKISAQGRISTDAPQRLASTRLPVLEARPFLRYLQTNHPQLLYKSLFTCSAAASTSSLTRSLRILKALTTLIGPWGYFVRSDPQMVAIVLLGGAGLTPKQGKAKEGVAPQLTVKLGRYAVLVELLRALDKDDASIKADDRVKGFMEQLEVRVGAMIESEVGPVVEKIRWVRRGC